MRLLFSAALSILLLGSGLAQPPAPVTTRVLVTITDKSGYPPEVALKDRLQVREDKIVQKIDSVEPASSLPIHLAIFMDKSGQFAHYKTSEQDAVTEFLEHFIRNGTDKPYMLAFGEGASSMNSIRDYSDYRAARNQNQIASGEEILGSMQAFVEALRKTYGDAPDRRAVIIFSNGGAQISRDELPRLQAYAVANRLTVFEVDTDWTQRRGFFGSTIRELVANTGGTVELPSNVKQFAGSLNQMGARISNQYEVTYETTHPDGKMHALNVRSLDKNLVVQGPTQHTTPKV